MKLAKRYFEIDNSGKLDDGTNEMLENLKNRIANKITDEKIFRFKIDWQMIEASKSIKNSHDYFNKFGQTFFK